MRPIDADALLDFLDVGHLRPPTEICFSELMMKNIIDIQPTVDAVPVRHGHWIVEWETDDTRMLRCSECRMVFNVGKGRDGNYCPNCGAKMYETQKKPCDDCQEFDCYGCEYAERKDNG